MPTFQEAHQRHASYFGNILQKVNTLYLQGGESTNHALSIFDLERPNIEVAQKWSEKYSSNHSKAAWFCASLPEIGSHVLDLRHHPYDRIQWLKAAINAARHFNLNKQFICSHLANLGAVYLSIGQPHCGIKYLHEALVVAREIEDLQYEGVALGNLGNAYSNLGDLARAVNY